MNAGSFSCLHCWIPLLILIAIELAAVHGFMRAEYRHHIPVPACGSLSTLRTIAIEPPPAVCDIVDALDKPPIVELNDAVAVGSPYHVVIRKSHYSSSNQAPNSVRLV